MSYRMKGSSFKKTKKNLQYWEKWLKSRGASTQPTGMGSLDPHSGHPVGNWLLRNPKDIHHIKAKSTRSTVFGTKAYDMLAKSLQPIKGQQGSISRAMQQQKYKQEAAKQLQRMKGRRLRREGGLIQALKMGPKASRMYKAFRGAAGRNPWVKAAIGTAGAIGAYLGSKSEKKK